MTTVEMFERCWAPILAPLTSDFYGIESVFEELISKYREKHRYYHTEQHLLDIFEQAKGIWSCVSHAAALALFFHDVVYFPGSPNNEAESARYANEQLSLLGLSPNLLGTVERFISSTAYVQDPKDFEESLIRDLDFSVFLKDRDGLLTYDLQIREEYSNIPSSMFFPLRKRFLESLLEDRVFFSPMFVSKEEEAKRNVRILLAGYGGVPSDED